MKLVQKVSCSGKIPPGRWGHTSTAVGSRLFIFGGTGTKLYGDLCVFDTEKNFWSSPNLHGDIPGARFGHSATQIDSNRILFFGGRGAGDKHFSDIYLLDTENFQFTLLNVDKNSPEPRAGHTASKLGKKLIFFGGHGKNQKYFNNVSVLDLETMKWEKPKVKGKPPHPRGGHCSVIVSSSVLIFGGFGGKTYYNDVHLLNTETWTWSQAHSPSSVGVRSGHTATQLNQKLIVCGGCGDNSQFLHDIQILDLENLSWQTESVNSTGLFPRFRHTCNLVHNTLYVFGGTGSGTLLNDVYTITYRTDSSDSSRNNVEEVASTNTLQLPSAQAAQNINPQETNKLHNELSSSSDDSAHFSRSSSVDTELSSILSSASEASISRILFDRTRTKNVSSTETSSCLSITESSSPKGKKGNESQEQSVSSRQLVDNVLANVSSQSEQGTPDLTQLYLCAAMALKKEKERRIELESKLTFTEQSLKEVSLRCQRMEAFEHQIKVAESEIAKFDLLFRTEQDKNKKMEKLLKGEKEKNAKQTGSRTMMETTLAETKEAMKRLQETVTSVEQRFVIERQRRLDSEAKQKALEEKLQVYEKMGQLPDEAPFVFPNEKKSATSLETLQQNLRLEKEKLIQDHKAEIGLFQQKNQDLKKLLKEERKTNQVLEQKLGDKQKEIDDIRAQLDHAQRELQRKIDVNRNQAEVVFGLKQQTAQLMGYELGSLHFAELEKLDEQLHAALKRVNIAKQEQYLQQLEDLKREKEILQEANLCVACTDNTINVVLIPCRHRVLCSGCASLLHKCPICRKDIQQKIETY
eukprot:TRINITY_DN2816_c0_g1_i1.p1 TRINITY_DN2816_c0_g1~~TRINITY_DN2816_c0_g1_i1.p1  ORF type:complete len:807 (-),score=184.57 TRINITY_DN2816_c0_g1_i1:38-2458(-)